MKQSFSPPSLRIKGFEGLLLLLNNGEINKPPNTEVLSSIYYAPEKHPLDLRSLVRRRKLCSLTPKLFTHQYDDNTFGENFQLEFFIEVVDCHLSKHPPRMRVTKDEDGRLIYEIAFKDSPYIFISTRIASKKYQKHFNNVVRFIYGLYRYPHLEGEEYVLEDG